MLVNGVELAVETFGDRSDPAVVLIAGVAASMDSWDNEFCRRLARSRFVIRYEQRVTQSSADPPGQPPHRSSDLVDDLFGLLDQYDIERAHLVGVSMGGGVAVLAALARPRRVASLTLIGTSGGPGEASWRSRLSTLDVPTLVIHGAQDPHFPLTHGRALADEIPGAKLLTIEGMGHEAPPRASWDFVVPAILTHTSGGWPQAADRLASRSLAEGDPTGWFERLYADAAAGEVGVPWDTDGPRELLVEWARARPRGNGRRALVVGAGLGQNAEFIAGLGYTTAAFDISPTAVELVKQRFPNSTVDYQVADLLDPPAAWTQGFDLVVEVFTVQAMPVELRAQATANVARFVAPDGVLVVVAEARRPDQTPPDGPPWPLTRAELDGFATDGLAAVRVEELPGPDGRHRWWRAELHRPSS